MNAVRTRRRTPSFPLFLAEESVEQTGYDERVDYSEYQET